MPGDKGHKGYKRRKGDLYWASAFVTFVTSAAFAAFCPGQSKH